MSRKKIIGVCLSTIDEEDRLNFVDSLNKFAIAKDYRVIVFNSCADLYENNSAVNRGESAVFKLIPYEMLSALIIMPNIMYDSDIVDDVVRKCKTKNIPLISIDKKIDGALTYSFKNGKTFEKLCCHVIEDHNAKNIYMMAGYKDNVYSEERIQSFRNALEKNGLPFIQENIGYGCFWEIPTLNVLDRWFKIENREIPDAIICANDFMAITVSSYLQQMGVAVPEDCIVTGFDGIKQAEYLPPRITTCKQDVDKMCSLIVDAIESINNGNKLNDDVYLDFSIIYSQSCGCQKINYKEINRSIRSLIDSLRFSEEREKKLCKAQASIPKIPDIYELPKVLTEKFHVKTCVFALNEHILNSDSFEQGFNGDYSFSDNVNIIYHRYGEIEEEACIIPIEQLVPDLDTLCESAQPIVVYSANFSEKVMGYCVFQIEKFECDEFTNLHNLMCIVDAALGDFYNRMRISSMNKKLIEANDELERLSRHDYMTGLYNRRGFFKILNESIGKSDSNSSLIMISVDLDGLKYINDTFGHSEGDNAISTVARALISTSLNNEICARFGGDEFCVAVIVENNMVESYFDNFKEAFLEFINEYNSKSNKEYLVSASFGCHHQVISEQINPEKIINIADEKMYRYKVENKKNRR